MAVMNIDQILRAVILNVTPFQQNCILLWSNESKSGVIIDPGGEVGRICDAIFETGMTPEKIMLTHGHIDHAGGATLLGEKLGVDIIGPHEDDAPLLSGLAVQGELFGVAPDDSRPVVPSQWLLDQDRIIMAGREFEVLHCPGHSPGHVVYIDHTARFIIMGDVLFQGSIGRTDLPYGDHATLLHAIKSKLLTLDDDYRFLCGHGPGSTIGQERRTNPFLV